MVQYDSTHKNPLTEINSAGDFFDSYTFKSVPFF